MAIAVRVGRGLGRYGVEGIASRHVQLGRFSTTTKTAEAYLRRWRRPHEANRKHLKVPRTRGCDPHPKPGSFSWGEYPTALRLSPGIRIEASLDLASDRIGAGLPDHPQKQWETGWVRAKSHCIAKTFAVNHPQIGRIPDPVVAVHIIVAGRCARRR